MRRIFQIIPVLLVLLPACAPDVNAQQPNIIIITMDTTRADRMGFLGSKKGLTPNLDALAREGVVFTRAYSQAPITTVSHATLLTGLFPLNHGVETFGVPLPGTVPYLADLLHQRGYATGAFVGSMILDSVNGLAPGFDRGFDKYDAGYRNRGRGESRYETLERRAADVVARAIQWLGQVRSKPVFLWIHVYDPHEPYDPPAPFRQKFASPYDGEIAYVDNTMGKLFADLKSRRLWDNSVIAVMADHGESFGEHGERTHGVFLYDSTIHVPLLIKFPQGRFAGKHAGGRVELVDVAPTLLEAVGAPIPKPMNGRSLIAMLSRMPEREAPAYSETKYPAKAFGWSSLAALRTDRYLYIRSPRPEVYDLTEDPDAKLNLAASNKALSDRLGQQLENFEKFYRSSAAPQTTPDVDPRLMERLAALGYVASGSEGKSVSGADPKDKIEVANQLHAATLLMEDQDYARAIPILQKIISTDPQIFAAHTKLGTALFESGKIAESLVPLRAAVEIQGDSPQARVSLGRSLMLLGDCKSAVEQFAIAAQKSPKWAGPLVYLGTCYGVMREPQKAIDSLRAATVADANDYRANLLLGRILAVQGEPRQGLTYLERAVQLRQDSREAYRFLGDCYQQLGRAQDAARARAKAASLPVPSRRPDNFEK